MSRTEDSGAKGHAILELAICLPFLVGVSFAGIEFARALQHVQMATHFSNELASQILRDCLSHDEVNWRLCLDTYREVHRDFAERIHPGTQVIVSSYAWDSNTRSYKRLGISPRGAGFGGDKVNGIWQTKLGVAQAVPMVDPVRGSPLSGTLEGSTLTGALRASTLQNHGTLIIAEAYVPFKSIIPGFAGIFSFAPEAFYDITAI